MSTHTEDGTPEADRELARVDRTDTVVCERFADAALWACEDDGGSFVIVSVVNDGRFMSIAVDADSFREFAERVNLNVAHARQRSTRQP